MKANLAILLRPLGTAGLLLVALLGLYGRAFLPGNTFSGMDFVNLLYPHAVLAKDAFRQGVIPLWNWYEWGGSPFLAPMQAGVLYPPMWLTLLLPLPYGLQLNVLFHLVLAGAGAVLLARQLFPQAGAASLYAGLGYAGSSFLFGHLEQVNSVAAIAWTPWIFLAALQVAGRRASALPLIGVTTLALLAGHPQYLVLSLLAGIGYFAVVLLLQRRWKSNPASDPAAAPSSISASALLPLALALLAAGVLAAAQLLPTRELSELSERVWPYPDPHQPALSPKHLPALLVPRYYQHLADTGGRPLGYTELGLYAGLLTPFLFVAGAISLLRRRHACGSALVALWLAALYYAFGSVQVGGVEIGLSAIVLKLVPFLAQSRGSARALNVATLCYVLIAAYGLSRLVSWRRIAESLRTPIRYAAAGLLLADLSLTFAPELKSRIAPAEILTERLPQERWKTSATAPLPRLYRFMAHDSDYYLDDRATAVRERRRRLQPNLNAVEGIPTTDGYEEGLLPTRAYADFLRRYNRNLRSDSPDAPLLALLGARAMLTEYPLQPDSRHWTPAPSGVPNLARWDSRFSPSPFLSAHTLSAAVTKRTGETPAPASLNKLGSPPRRIVAPPVRPGQQAIEHLFRDLRPEDLAAAAADAALRIETIGPNRLGLREAPTRPREPQPRREILFLQAPYPGWKLVPASDEGSSLWAEAMPLTPRSPIFSSFTWSEGTGASGRATLAFAPFSFRLGVFLTLLMGGALIVARRGARGRRYSNG